MLVVLISIETRNAAAKAKLKAKKREMENLCAQVSTLVKEVSDGFPFIIEADRRLQ
jgi:hypothetical protein